MVQTAQIQSLAPLLQQVVGEVVQTGRQLVLVVLEEVETLVVAQLLPRGRLATPQANPHHKETLEALEILRPQQEAVVVVLVRQVRQGVQAQETAETEQRHLLLELQ